MRPSLKALGGLSLAAFAACAGGGGAPASAKTFVYVSNAQDGNIDAYVMDKTSGALTPVGKAEAGKLVMPMAVSRTRSSSTRSRGRSRTGSSRMPSMPTPAP
jgi:hypothetical protein